MAPARRGGLSHGAPDDAAAGSPPQPSRLNARFPYLQQGSRPFRRRLEAVP